MEDCHSLKELILVIVALNTKCKTDKSSLFVGKCAEFCIYLIQYLEENPSQSNAVNAVDDFLMAIKKIDSFSGSDEVSLTNTEERIDQTITKIKASHPSLRCFKGGPHRGLPGTVMTVLEIGIPVIGILKEAVETVGMMPFMKPVLAAVLAMSQAARQTQSNFNEMLSLSSTAGEFVLRIVEHCSVFQELPPNLDNAIKKLERYVCLEI
ncbi:hypothetical protein H1R20_g12112, partial [Candolleomyces eurysporus]